MIIGVPKEIKLQENRVGLSPAGASTLVAAGHKVIIEKDAGVGAGFLDEEFEEEGAIIYEDAAKIWEEADFIIKVKEPLESEFKYFRKGLILFTYLHLAANKVLIDELVKSEMIAIAYETVQTEDYKLPLLAPMSEVAGRVAIQKACQYLEKPYGGRGILLDGIPGVAPASVVIIGAGTAGTAAARRAIGLGCRVCVVDKNIDRLKYLSEVFMGKLETLYSNHINIKNVCKHADVVISSVLIPGGKAPKLITEEIVKSMVNGAIIIDIAIDQGGSVETITAPTNLADPIFVKHGVIHYAVANIPGSVAKSSTLGLTNATLDYAVKIANLGWKEAMRRDTSLKKGLNIALGHVVYKSVADAFDMAHINVDTVLE